MKTIKTLVKEQIDQEQDYINEHKKVLEVLKPLEGKQFNLRTFNKKALQGFKFESKYGMFHLMGKYQHLIGYRETDGVNCEAFEKFDSCHWAGALERIEKLKVLDVKELQKKANAIKKHFNELRFLFGDLEKQNFGSYHNPVYYEMLRQIYDGDGTTSQSEIELHKFYYIKKSR
jgi:uncharacterized protein YecA (UPF0149 family)